MDALHPETNEDGFMRLFQTFHRSDIVSVADRPNIPVDKEAWNMPDGDYSSSHLTLIEYDSPLEVMIGCCNSTIKI